MFGANGSGLAAKTDTSTPGAAEREPRSLENKPGSGLIKSKFQTGD